MKNPTKNTTLNHSGMSSFCFVSITMNTMSRARFNATRTNANIKLNDESLIHDGTTTPKSPRHKSTRKATESPRDKLRTMSDGFLFFMNAPLVYNSHWENEIQIFFAFCSLDGAWGNWRSEVDADKLIFNGSHTFAEVSCIECN